MFDINLEKTPDELLQDVRMGAINAADNNKPGLAFTPLAVLLVRLSRDASEIADKNMLTQKHMASQTDKMLLLTKWMCGLTGIILAVSIALLAVSVR